MSAATTPASPPPKQAKGIILVKKGGCELDHIGLACRNLEEAIGDFEQQTGVKPVRLPASPKVPFENAIVRLNDEGSFLEILGPNAGYRGVHPLKSLLKDMKEPTLWFWYVATNDFDGLKEKIENNTGKPVVNKVVQENEGTHDGMPQSTYITAQIGPGFDPVRPNLVQWLDWVEPKEQTPICNIEDFTVCSTTYESDRDLLESIGMASVDRVLRPSTDGKRSLSLTIATPRMGSVTFANETKPVGLSTVLKCMFKDLFGFL